MSDHPDDHLPAGVFTQLRAQADLGLDAAGDPVMLDRLRARLAASSPTNSHRHPIRRWRTGLLVSIAGFLVATGIAGAATGLWNPPLIDRSARQTPPLPGPAPVSDLDAKQQSLRSLRQPESTVLPKRLRSVITDVTQAGENPALGRQAFKTSFGPTLYVVPAANNEVCVNLDSGSGACAPVKKIATGKFSGAFLCVTGVPRNHLLYYGMLPDRAGDAALTFADGDVRQLPITNNVYAVALPRSASPSSVSWFEAGAQRQAPAAPVPPPRIRCAPPKGG